MFFFPYRGESRKPLNPKAMPRKKKPSSGCFKPFCFALLLVLSVWIGCDASSLSKNGVETTATVLKIDKNYMGETRIRYRFKVFFDGKYQEYKSSEASHGQKFRNAASRGNRGVPIVYDPENPRRSVIGVKGDLWSGTLIDYLFNVAFVGIFGWLGFSFGFSGRKRKKR